MNSLTYENPLHTLVMEYNNYKSGSSEKNIAQMLLKNISFIPDCTIEQAAERCNISVSTLRRFIHNLGYASYTDFRTRVKENIESIDLYYPAEINHTDPESTPYLENYYNLIRMDLEQLIKHVNRNEMVQAVHMLHNHNHIFIHDILKGGMRVFLERNLALSGKLITMSYDYSSQIADTDNVSADCLFFVVYDGMKHSKIVLQTIERAKKKNAAVIAISRQKLFTNSELCDLIIYTPSGSCMISSLLLLDMVYQYLAELYRSIYLV